MSDHKEKVISEAEYEIVEKQDENGNTKFVKVF